MKKNYSIIALIIALCVLVTAFAACNKEKVDSNDETSVSEIVSESGYSAVINESNAVISKDGKKFQTVEYPQNIGHTFVLEYAKDHYEFIDMNFDGDEDFYIAVSNVDGVISYYAWIYNATAKKFEHSAYLSMLKNISVDSIEQLILSETEFDGGRQISVYTWDNGQLVFNEKYNENDGAIPENVTSSFNDNKIGEVSNSEKVTEVSTTVADKEETTTKKSGDNKPGKDENKPGKEDKTTKPNKPDKNEKPNKEDKTTKPSTTKPLLTTTTPVNDIVLESSDPESGWF